MTRYAVIELGKVLGVWLAVALVLVAGVGLLLWTSWFAAAHVLAWVYRRRGYRAVVIRDGIEIRVRCQLKLLRFRPITDAEYAEFAARWRAEHARPQHAARRGEVVDSTKGGLS